MPIESTWKNDSNLYTKWIKYTVKKIENKNKKTFDQHKYKRNMNIYSLLNKNYVMFC